MSSRTLIVAFSSIMYIGSVSVVDTFISLARRGVHCETGLPISGGETENTMYMQFEPYMTPDQMNTQTKRPFYVWPSIKDIHAQHPRYPRFPEHTRTMIPVDCDAIKKDFTAAEQGLILDVLTDINAVSNCITFKHWSHAANIMLKVAQHPSYVRNFTPINRFYTGVKFVKNNKDSTKCQVRYRGDIKHDPLFALMTLGSSCFDYETIMHETIHTLGFPHEQSRRNRDNYIAVWNQNIEPGFESQYKIADRLNFTDVGPYSTASIMHYGPEERAKSGRVAWASRDFVNRMVALGVQEVQLANMPVSAFPKMPAANPTEPLNKIDKEKINLVYTCDAEKEKFIWSDRVCEERGDQWEDKKDE